MIWILASLFWNTVYLLSQGKEGTQLRCGGKYYIGFVDNLILFRMMKQICKSVKVWQSYGREFSGFLFWPTLYVLILLSNRRITNVSLMMMMMMMITSKRYELLITINRKSHTGFRLVPTSVTLNRWTAYSPYFALPVFNRMRYFWRPIPTSHGWTWR